MLLIRIFKTSNYLKIIYILIFYIEIDYFAEQGYHMGSFLCLGQPIHTVDINNAKRISEFKTFQEIHDYMSIHGKVLIFLGKGLHKIKKKAEQMACSDAIAELKSLQSSLNL